MRTANAQDTADRDDPHLADRARRSKAKRDGARSGGRNGSSPAVAPPISGDPRQAFYALSGAAIADGRIESTKFNSLVDKASRTSFAEVLSELKAIIGG